MTSAERFRNVSLALAAGSTVLYWSTYADNRRVTSERRATQLATAMPIPLNGFRPTLRGVVPHELTAETDLVERDKPRIMFVVSDRCPGSAIAVPQWIDWIRNTRHRRYSAVIASIEGAQHQTQIADALASRGVVAALLQVAQVQEFSVSSGVSATPALLGMDRAGHVRVIGGTFTQETRVALDELLGSDEAMLAGH